MRELAAWGCAMTQHSPSSQNGDGVPSPPASKYHAVVFVVVGLVAVLGLALSTWGPGELKPETFRFELMRISLQILGVALVGAFVGTAVFRLQQVQLDRSKNDAEAREEARLCKRRQADYHIDKRRRLDGRIESFLHETIAAYHAVKRIRRVLEAEMARDPELSIASESYSRLVTELSNQQLAFESLMRRAPLIQGLFGGLELEARVSRDSDKVVVTSLENHYAQVESYLNDVVDEYQKKNGLVKVGAFVYNTPDFKANVSYRVNAVIKAFEEALLTPEPTPVDQPK